jgi:tetratricopeptide (TPR) repeat protein
MTTIPTPVVPRFRLLARGLLAAWAAVLVASMATSATAQIAGEVHRLAGAKITGELELTPNAVTVTTQSGSSTRVGIEEIRFVRFADEPDSLSNARSLLLRRSGADAAEEIAKVTPADRAAATTPVLADIAFVTAAADGYASIVSGADVDKAVKGLRDFVASNSRSHNLYAANEVLGGVLARAGRYADAAAAYGELSKGPPALAARAAVLRAELQTAQGKAAEAMRDYEAAAAAATKVPGDGGRQARLAAELGKARCLVLLDKPADAIAACRTVIGGCRPDDAELLSRAFLVLGTAQLASGSMDHDAAASLLTVDLVHNGVPEDRAEALYHLVGLWERANHPERAREARQVLEATFPDSPWTRKLRGGKPS